MESGSSPLESVGVNPSFWSQKKVLVTGHTGFKGAWLCVWLAQWGAVVRGVALAPDPKPNIFEKIQLFCLIESLDVDIRDFEALSKAISEFQPEIVFHLAAQPLVRRSYRDPVETFSTNILGTVNVLEACRHCDSVRVVINVTSDKCYQNQHLDRGYIESDPMGGDDPYSSSKGCSELISNAYTHSFYQKIGKGLASARAGNVIGMGDFSEDRLIPDCVRGLLNHQPIRLRYPQAIRPWQHVLEPLAGYLMLADSVWKDPVGCCSGWNFGPSESGFKTVAEVVEGVLARYGQGSWQLEPGNISLYEAEKLMLDSTRALSLGWCPRLSVEEALDWTVEGYQVWARGGDVLGVMHNQILKYINRMEKL